MLTDEAIKEFVTTVGLRLEFQSTFANLMPACKMTAIV